MGEPLTMELHHTPGSTEEYTESCSPYNVGSEGGLTKKMTSSGVENRIPECPVTTMVALYGET